MSGKERHVYVVDDDEAVTQSLTALLGAAGYEVTTFSSGVSFLGAPFETFTGCVLLDVRMPGKDGLTVLREALSFNPRLSVIMISGHGDVPMAVRAMKLGALDFVEKPFKAEIILAALERACQIAVKSSADDPDAAEARSKIECLTPREYEITEKLVEGKPNKIIAFELGISIRTVETHRSRILTKLQIRSLAELARLHLLAMSSHP